ncbi:hypothetical protein HDU84_007884, partial [Entophlyctis sp. JEL0112]
MLPGTSSVPTATIIPDADLDGGELIALLDRYILEEQVAPASARIDSDSSSSEDDSDADIDGNEGDGVDAGGNAPKGRLGPDLRERKHHRQLDQFLVLLAVSMQEYGCPTAALERHMNEVALGLGSSAKFSFFNGYAFASWESNSFKLGKTHYFGAWSGLDVYKLQLCDELARHVASYSKSGPESNLASSNVSLHENSSTNQSSHSLLKILSHYLGGTLYGIRLGLTKAQEKNDSDLQTGYSNTDKLKSRILYLASVGPNVFAQFKAVKKKSETDEGASSAVGTPLAEHLEIPETVPTVPGEAIRPQIPGDIDLTNDTVVVKRRKNNFMRISQLARSFSGHSNSIKKSAKKSSPKHVQVFTSIAVSDALSRLKAIRAAPSPYPS